MLCVAGKREKRKLKKHIKIDERKKRVIKILVEKEKEQVMERKIERENGCLVPYFKSDWADY